MSEPGTTKIKGNKSASQEIGIGLNFVCFPYFLIPNGRAYYPSPTVLRVGREIYHVPLLNHKLLDKRRNAHRLIIVIERTINPIES